MMSGLENKSFIVFHDAYQYFEKAYNLKAVGSITLEPDESPSPKRIKEIRHKLIESEVKCVFREPQFSDRLVNVAIEGSSAKSGTLDPLGTDLMVGEGLYLELLKNLGLSLKQGLN
jgi:zinc transport system substrate-binding protein